MLTREEVEKLPDDDLVFIIATHNFQSPERAIAMQVLRQRDSNTTDKQHRDIQFLNWLILTVGAAAVFLGIAALMK